MSRSGYSEDIDQWDLIRWRGAVTSALRGARGQALLRDMLAALDSLSGKRLIAGELEEAGEVCALGAVGRLRGVDMRDIDPEDYEQVAPAFNVADALAREVMFQNDEAFSHETPEQRWSRMRAWVVSQILPGTTS